VGMTRSGGFGYDNKMELSDKMVKYIWLKELHFHAEDQRFFHL
jgi:hypothetical protein